MGGGVVKDSIQSSVQIELLHPGEKWDNSVPLFSSSPNSCLLSLKSPGQTTDTYLIQDQLKLMRVEKHHLPRCHFIHADNNLVNIY